MAYPGLEGVLFREFDNIICMGRMSNVQERLKAWILHQRHRQLIGYDKLDQCNDKVIPGNRRMTLCKGFSNGVLLFLSKASVG